MGRIGRVGFAALLGAWLALAAPVASAAVYKCQGSDGERVYSDSGCVTRGGYERPTATAVDPLQAGGKAGGAGVRDNADEDKGKAFSEDTEDSEEIEDGGEPATAGVPTKARQEPRDPNLPQARQMIPGFRVLFVLGAVLLLLSYILMFVSAFRDKLTAWGIVLVMFPPLSMLIYPIFHWRRARMSFVMLLIGSLLGAAFYVPPVDMITVHASYLSSRPGKLSSKRAATTSFAINDTIYLRTKLRWEDVWVQTPHRVTWVWSTGDRLREEVKTRLHFERSPFVLQGNLPATDLGPGRHRVEVFVDGRQLDSREFTVRP